MTKSSHSRGMVLFPESTADKDKAKAREWKQNFIKTAINGEPEDEKESPDYTEAIYDCLCDIGTSLRSIADAIKRIEDGLK